MISSLCEICSSESFSSHQASEKMFGMGGSFLYKECRNCGVLNLDNIPENLDQYYPSNYYSLQPQSPLKKFIKRRRGSYSFGHRTLVGSLASKLLGPSPVLEWFNHAGVSTQNSILDVGCGTGSFLQELVDVGFKELVGVDPYIQESTTYRSLKFVKSKLEDFTGSFDFIMLNHSFEHMLKPLSVLKSLKRIVSQKGTVLIRIPLVSYAWERYKTNWYGLDAPRHFFLYTQKSFKLLCEQAGFSIEKTIFDSSDMQFWASEQYQKNIYLESEESYLRNPKKSIFTKDDINNFCQRAVELNEQEQGDSASFYLKRKDI